MKRKQAENIVHEMKTQDGRCTADPIYVVKVKERIYGMDPDYGDDNYCYVDEDFNECHPDDLHAEYGITEEQFENGENGGYDQLQKVYYIEKNRVVNFHFTEKAAQRFIDANRHNLNKPFIYVDSLYRCYEMIDIRNFLMSDEFVLSIGSVSVIKSMLSALKKALKYIGDDKGTCDVCSGVTFELNDDLHYSTKCPCYSVRRAINRATKHLKGV